MGYNYSKSIFFNKTITWVDKCVHARGARVTMTFQRGLSVAFVIIVICYRQFYEGNLEKSKSFIGHNDKIYVFNDY